MAILGLLVLHMHTATVCAECALHEDSANIIYNYDSDCGYVNIAEELCTVRDETNSLNIPSLIINDAKEHTGAVGVASSNLAQSVRLNDTSENPSIAKETSHNYDDIYDSVASYSKSDGSKDRLTMSLRCGEHSVAYTDSTVKPLNHIMELDFAKRCINSPVDQKIIALISKHNDCFDKIEAIDYVFPSLDKSIEELVQQTNIEPINSKIKFYPKRDRMFEISKEKNGYIIDKIDIKERLFDHIVGNRYTPSARSVFRVSPTILPPELRQIDNCKCTSLISKFDTSFGTSIDSRKHNIRLSLASINGTVLEPRETFSFNGVVGDRTQKNGYQESKIIVKGRFVEGIGGGVCQVSTTLYNAAIRADMAIVSVHGHSLPISYVPPSFDAMVNSGTSDLKFQNKFDTPIFIKAYAKDDRAIIEFYGKPLAYRIIPESETIDTLPPPAIDEEIVDIERKYISEDMASGQRIKVLNGRGGIVSRGYISYIDKNGTVIIRKQIRNDKYMPQQGLVAIAP